MQHEIIANEADFRETPRSLFGRKASGTPGTARNETTPAADNAAVETAPDALAVAVRHLEAAAYHGHAFAAYNLGVAHLFGHGVRSDATLSAAWFEASGLPEGAILVAAHRAITGAPRSEVHEWRRRAVNAGYGAGHRALARASTGTGGAGGVSLHSAWPIDGGGCARL